jgi:hypothetical protein
LKKQDKEFFQVLGRHKLTDGPSVVIDTGVDNDRANVVIISHSLIQGLEN